MKRKIIVWTTVCFLTWLLAVPSIFVFAEEGKQTETDPYHYTYQGDQYETSDHFFTFQWWYKDASREQIRNRYHATNIFKLANETDSADAPAAYCSDFLYSIVSKTKYKRLNLEDSTYYNEAAARHIRSIIENGYWYDWTSADLAAAEAKVNDWMENYDSSTFETDAFLPYDAEEEVEKISNLTTGEALMATQLAIWAFANTEGDDWWVKYYESLPTDTENQYQSQELPDNVKGFRKYLIHQQSQPLVPEDILFSDQYFITDSVTFTGSPEDAAVYNLILKIKLAAPIDPRDNLTLTATCTNGKSKEFPLTGDNKLVPDDNGYYALSLNDITKDDVTSVTLTLSGQQYAEGIYFYEAKSEEGTPRETSQNLVGKASGLTPVSVSANLTYETGTETVSLYKKDAETALPLEGAVFDLYGEKEEKSYLVLQNLTTNASGCITVSNLPDGFNYYFVETEAPEGYQFEAGKKCYINEKSTVEIFNQKIPVPIPEPEPEQTPEKPIIPQTPDKIVPETPQTDAPKEPASMVPAITPVESVDSETAEESSPKTGDSAPLMTFLLLLMSAFGLFFSLIRRNK